jgi:hypothetical protein
MPTAPPPIRLDRELDAAARDAARIMSRNVAEQVSHWARIGRELERSPEIAVSTVRDVLAGRASYGRLRPPEQALVRADWDEQLSDKLARLDLSQAFAAAAHRYAELDDQGELSVITPGTPQ